MFITSNTKSKLFFVIPKHGVGSIFRGSPLVDMAGESTGWGHGLLMNITLGPNEVSGLVDMATVGMLTYAKEADSNYQYAISAIKGASHESRTFLLAVAVFG
jgi:hypothetical protein